MKSQSQNRVLAMKNKFENLNNDEELLLNKSHRRINSQLYKQDNNSNNKLNDCDITIPILQSKDVTESEQKVLIKLESRISSDENTLTPNSSYLYAQQFDSDAKKLNLSRQSSDPGKKLHRSHAFRCDKSQKIVSTSPKRHGSCNGRSESTDFKIITMEKPKLSKEKLKKLGNLLEDRMKKDNFVTNSIPDEEVPKHILDQYAKVLKPKRNPELPLIEKRQDGLTDSGVSSETENLEEAPEKPSRLKQLKAQFETADKTDSIIKKSNLELLNNDDLCCSSETMRLERINPHIDLTDTLKKALKQPLPSGPPPKKPPRSFVASPPPQEGTKIRKDAKKMLEKLEQVFSKREEKPDRTIYDVAETDLSPKNKEIHYLCTEILDITHRTLLPNTQKSPDVVSNCFNNLNCGIVPTKSTTSLPYTRLSTNIMPPRNSLSNLCCSCSADSLDYNEENKQKFSTFFAVKPNENLCKKCNSNLAKTGRFQCHLNCKCRHQQSEFFVQNEHIYDEPHIEGSGEFIAKGVARKSMELPSISTSLEVNSDGLKVYGTIKSVKSDGVLSRSLEDLRSQRREDLEEKIYDIPCELSKTPSPEFGTVIPRKQFESLRMSFENGFKHKPTEKPPFAKTPSDSKINSSNEAVSEEFKTAKKKMEKKFATEIRKPRLYEKSNLQSSSNNLTVPKKKNLQLDVDKENLNRLMNEIYETVSAACRMEDQLKPIKFPIDPADGTSSEDSIKLTRSLTEKRKTYVRRVSSRAGYLERNNKNKRYRNQTSVCSYKSENLHLDHNPYSTFRTWKSFRNSQNNLNQSKMDDSNLSDSKFNLTDSSGNLLTLKDDFSNLENLSLDNLSLDEKAGCLDLDLPLESRERALFDLCLLVGLNYMTGQSYVKSVFPSQVTVPQHVGNLVFPEHLKLDDPNLKPEFDLQASRSQCYSLVLTNEKGERNYGYCRRVLPEGATCCLPLCYCIISRYRAPGFYYKVLQEIESQHGNSEIEINTILHQLIDCEFPNPGEEIQIQYSQHSNIRNSQIYQHNKKCQTLPNTFDAGKLSNETSPIPAFYDIENNNNTNKGEFSMARMKVLRRPIEPRIDEDNLSVLLDSLGPSLTVKIFGSLLLERKVVFISDNLSQLSSCIEALQLILYPFVWQQPLISTIPSELRKDILEAPLPILAGLLKRADECTEFVQDIQFQEGMLIDLTNSNSKLIHNQGDESSILPTTYYKTLKNTLQLESSKNTQKDQDTEKTRNVLISEAFLRFFVDVFAEFWNYFSFGEVKEGDLGRDDVVFDKDKFIKEANPKQVDFLEWFTETAMFSHFAQNMAACFAFRQRDNKIDFSSATEVIVDAPLPNYYELFNDRIISKLNTMKKSIKPENKCDAKSNYKSAMNKKIKVLKSKLKDLVN